MNPLKQIIRRMLLPRVEPIVLLDEHLNTKQYDINKPEPQFEIGQEVWN